MKYVHTPVLKNQILEFFQIYQDKVIVDGTIGEGGHSESFLRKIQPSRLIGIDGDVEILKKAKHRLEKFSNVDLVNNNFINLKNILQEKKIDAVDGILLDLGISIFHYKESGRGFSFDRNEKLDMRARKSEISAYDIVNTYSQDKLRKIIWAYGEDRWASLIAKQIVAVRASQKIKTAKELADLIFNIVPKKFHSHIHPATKTFQALRIEVNNELGDLEKFLNIFPELLNRKGRLAIITFQSLEDRIVKQKFRELSTGKIIDDLRGTRAKPAFRLLTRKPLIADENEIATNAASRSAKLRVIEKL